MTTLTEFLLARIAEDEAAARAAGGDLSEVSAEVSAEDAVALFANPYRRVLVECEARRQVVSLARAEGEILRALALPYADHDDYREEWRL